MTRWARKRQCSSASIAESPSAGICGSVPIAAKNRRSVRPVSAAPQKAKTYGHFRSGLLLMLLAAAVQYFAGGYSPLALPGEISSPLLTYLAPLLFLSGLAMSLWGFFLRVRA